MLNNMALTEFEIEQKSIETDKRKFTDEFELSKKIYAEMLRNEVGNDIKNVMTGKVKVKPSFLAKMRFKIKVFFKRIFHII